MLVAEKKNVTPPDRLFDQTLSLTVFRADRPGIGNALALSLFYRQSTRAIPFNF